MADQGTRVGRKRVERLMKAEGLAGVSRRKGRRATLRDERVRPARRGPHGRIPVDRRLVQPRPAPFGPGLPVTHQLRKRSPKTA